MPFLPCPKCKKQSFTEVIDAGNRLMFCHECLYREEIKPKSPVIKIGYYCKYKDPKDYPGSEDRIGLVISFDDDQAIVWKMGKRPGYPSFPYPIARTQITKGFEVVPGTWEVS